MAQFREVNIPLVKKKTAHLSADDQFRVLAEVEVKAEVNLRAKSLKTYQEKFAPEVSVRTSMADYKKEEWIVDLPLYAIDQIAQV